MVSEYLSIDVLAQIDNFVLEAKFVSASGITVITGPSASGKSSLLNCVAGLRKAKKGLIRCAEIVFFDSEKGINISPQKRDCGYVLQNLALFPHLNVAENICYGIDKQDRNKQKGRLSELLALVKMEGLESRPISALSGGQLQRVALARALAPSPKLLLLDEPFSALDAELREELGQELKSLQKNFGIPILLVTHSKSEALFLADTLVLMEDGRVKSSGSVHEILKPGGSSRLEGSAQFSW